MTYDELKAEIAGNLHRSDLTTEIPRFITKAEQRIGRDARLLENRVQNTVTPSSGVAALPTRFAEMRRISTGSGASLVILEAVPARAGNNYGTSGKSVAYYLSEQIYLLPANDTDIDIDYYEYPEPLAGAAGSATRPIMTRYESLYINAAMMEGSLFMQDFEAYGIWAQRYTAEVNQANKAAAEAYTPKTTTAYNFRAAAPRGA